MFDLSIYETYTVDGEGVPLDLIVWRRYKRNIPGLVEAALAITPGLADLGPLLPRGTVINIPVDTPSTVQQIPVVRLW